MTPAFRRGLLLVLLLCGMAGLLRAQVVTPDSARRAAQPPDSLRRVTTPWVSQADLARMDSAAPQVRSSKSTGLAMLLSGILPGAGQAYNESYWKVPIVTGLGIYFVSSWLDFNRRYLEYRDKYRASLREGAAADPTLQENYRISREFYKDERDGFAWYFLILYVLNIVDAYVDASLYDFNVGDDLSIDFLPDAGGGYAHSPGVRLSIRFR